METNIAIEGRAEAFFDLDKKPLYSERRSNSSYECLFDGIHIWYSRLDLASPVRINVKADHPIVQMKFNLTHGSDLYLDGKLLAKLPSKCHNLFHVTDRNDCYDQLQEGEQEIFGINIHADFFLHHCPQVPSGFLTFRQKVQNNESAVLAPGGMPISMAIRHIIHDIIHYKHAPSFRHVYLKAKVMELLTLQLEQHGEYGDNLPNGRLKSEELQRMQKVRQLMEERYDEEHSLLSLARSVGTNDATLKKHFKIAFGCTVFSYLTAIRMQRAKDMLAEKDAKIAHIANHIGYKHASHFSAAFKKHFGYLPTDFKE